MVTKKSCKKLPDDVLNTVSDALSSYLGQDIRVKDVSDPNVEDWHFSVMSDWMCNNRGIFEHVVSKYYINAEVIKHQFVDEHDKYRNGKVYRIYPHISWNHFNGGSNGHETNPEMIVIENVLNRWFIRTTLN